MFILKNNSSFTIVPDPFHEKYGLKKEDGTLYNEEELQDKGFFIDETPVQPYDGKYVLTADFDAKILFYKAKGDILKPKEKLQEERIIKLENDITVLQNSLVEQHYNELMKGVK